VRVARGASLVGRGRLAFVGTGEPFELGFGVDDGLRARRTVREERDTTSIIGTQRVRRTVTVHVSNLSDQARTALLTERIPVSEISDVTIALTEHTGWSLDGPAGLLRQTVDLAPGGVRSVSLAYEIRASAKVVLPF
jgi:hypothetical protein